MSNSFTPRARGRHNRYRGRSGSSRRGVGVYQGSRNRGRRSRGGRSHSQPINHEKFINKNPRAHVATQYIAAHTFSDFGLDERIVATLIKRGYTTPTRIQDEAMPHILTGRDVIGIANTGTGKTAAFVLPIIQKLREGEQLESVLIVTPTRELATQIQNEFKQFASGMRLFSTLCVGGLNIRAQIRELRRKPHAIIGTPGRLKDLINQGELRLNAATTLVLDEADRMLDMGFLPDIRYILGKTPTKRQSLCFSATMTPAVSKLLTVMLTDPVTVSVRTSETSDHIAQDVIKARTKEDKTKELIKMLPGFIRDHIFIKFCKDALFIVFIYLNDTIDISSDIFFK